MLGITIPLPATFSGILVPGAYAIGAAAAANLAVQLDCQGLVNAVFHFAIGGALSLNANVVRINGLCTVQWEVDGAVTVAAGFTADGDFAATGAITLGAGAHLTGHANAVGAEEKDIAQRMWG